MHIDRPISVYQAANLQGKSQLFPSKFTLSSKASRGSNLEDGTLKFLLLKKIAGCEVRSVKVKELLFTRYKWSKGFFRS